MYCINEKISIFINFSFNIISFNYFLIVMKLFDVMKLHISIIDN